MSALSGVVAEQDESDSSEEDLEEVVGVEASPQEFEGSECGPGEDLS
jgi:hypothetical protein